MDANNQESDDAREILTGIYPGLKLGSGRYTLLKEIGRGGGGEVWLATDSVLREPVALKLLSAASGWEGNALEALRLETSRSRRLSHPNIIRIYDFHAYAGEPPFISMEFVKGVNLEAVRMGSPDKVLKWDYLRPIFRELCDALVYAHGAGVVHRDLKPANLIVDEQGRLKLADFGIAARFRDRKPSDDDLHKGWGTLPYVSPQQLAGEAANPSDDIYSLGASLYELLAGKPPFPDGDIEARIRNDEPVSMTERLRLSGVTNDIPPGVDQVVMDCLAKVPARRPITARDVQTRLENAVIMRGVGKAAVPETRRVEGTGVAGNAKPAPAGEQKPRLTLQKARAGAVATAGELGAERVGGLGRARKARKIPVGWFLLALVLGAGWWIRRDLDRQPAVHGGLVPRQLVLLTNVVMRPERLFAGAGDDIVSLAISADGGRLIAGNGDQTAHLWEVSTGRAKQFKGEGGLFGVVAIAPDGKWLVSAGVGATVKLWQVDWRRLHLTLPGPTNGLAAVVFSPDGQWLAGGGKDGRVVIWQAATGRGVAAWQAHTGSVEPKNGCRERAPPLRRLGSPPVSAKFAASPPRPPPSAAGRG